MCPCYVPLVWQALTLHSQGTRLYQSIGVLWGYEVGPGEIMLPHDYLDDLESFFYVLCHPMLSRVAPGKPVNTRAERQLSMWQSSHPDNSRCYKAEFSAGILDGALVDTDYWGEACNKLLVEYHAFVGLVASRKTRIRYDYLLDHAEKVARLREIGKDVDKHYDTIDRLFQEALDLLKTEEPQIDARLATLESAARRNASHNRAHGLKRGSNEMEDVAVSGRDVKRRL